MSMLGAGHLINREMSRCQDVKMSKLVAGHLIGRKISRYQDVWTGVCVVGEMSGAVEVIVMRCQDV